MLQQCHYERFNKSFMQPTFYNVISRIHQIAFFIRPTYQQDPPATLLWTAAEHHRSGCPHCQCSYFHPVQPEHGLGSPACVLPCAARRRLRRLLMQLARLQSDGLQGRRCWWAQAPYLGLTPARLRFLPRQLLAACVAILERSPLCTQKAAINKFRHRRQQWHDRQHAPVNRIAAACRLRRERVDSEHSSSPRVIFFDSCF